MPSEILKLTFRHDTTLFEANNCYIYGAPQALSKHGVYIDATIEDTQVFYLECATLTGKQFSHVSDNIN